MAPQPLLWIEDASHAWLRVPLKVFEAMGVPASGYSYANDYSIYLEEDCDAPRFLKALLGKPSCSTITSEYCEKARYIRSLDRWTPDDCYT